MDNFEHGKLPFGVGEDFYVPATLRGVSKLHNDPNERIQKGEGICKYKILDSKLQFYLEGADAKLNCCFTDSK